MKGIEADTRPDTHLSLQYRSQVSKDISFSLKIKCSNQALQCLRDLFTKVFARRGTLTDGEKAFLYYVEEYVSKLRIESFNNDTVQQWFIARQLLKLYLSFPDGNYPNFAVRQLKLLIPQFAMTPRAFLGFKLDERSPKVFFDRLNRRLVRRPPPERYIGVGYRDQGATTDPSEDSSPAWQLVALERERYPSSMDNFLSRKQRTFGHLSLYNRKE